MRRREKPCPDTISVTEELLGKLYMSLIHDIQVDCTSKEKKATTIANIECLCRIACPCDLRVG